MASLKESFSKGITAINVKTNSFMEESKCKTYISTLEKEIQVLKLNIGEIVYSKSVIGESYEEAVAEIVQQITGKYQEIEQQKKAIEQLAIEEKQILGTSQTVESVKFCSQCGAQSAANYKFCTKCGSPLN
ncbi:MAG: zinc ribbon domain-containing protein [Alphaproteobacteria bacterium]|nr:zinc ribbon domain-containing protein [Alphaproteobacteria bacterium]MBQ6787668.1 zinc ribbon domain-containing protein [Lachnospiraceae bacterium]